MASSASDPTGLLDKLRTATKGKFTVIRELGRGGMGRVMLAQELALDRRVAMKVLPPALADHPEIVERFQREARTAGGLSHPHIVSVYQVYKLDEFAFFTMPYIAGPSLRQVLRNSPQLPFELTRRYLREAADALGFAHGKGIIHRDIKPENMLLEGSRDGRLMLTDFGIAKALGLGTTLTRPGDLMGTPYYMSPEQCESKDGIDPRSDQYSLGLVGYEMLAGRFAFTADSMAAIVYSHLHAYPEPLEEVRPDTPGDLKEVIWRAIQKNKEDRFPTMAEFLEALGKPAVRPFVVEQPPAAKTPKRKRRSGRWIAAAMFVVVAASAGAFLYKIREASSGSPTRLADLSLPVLSAGPADSLAGDSAGAAAVHNTAASVDTSGDSPDTSPVERPPEREPDTASPGAALRREVARWSTNAGQARRAAIEAGAEGLTLFQRADSTMRAAAAYRNQGKLRLAVQDFTIATSRFGDVKDLALEQQADLAAARTGDTTTVADGPEGPGGGGGGEEGPPVTSEPEPEPELTPEEAIAELLEAYRQAFEAEDLAAMGDDVYRGEIPKKNAQDLERIFKAADDIQLTLQTKELKFNQGNTLVEAKIDQRMRYVLSSTREQRETTIKMDMTFQRAGDGWRLVNLRIR